MATEFIYILTPIQQQRQQQILFFETRDSLLMPFSAYLAYTAFFHLGPDKAQFDLGFDFIQL